VVLKRPEDAFRSNDFINDQWQHLNYEAPPDLERSVGEHDAFAELLRGLGVEVLYLPAAPGTGLDSIYVRDAAIVCDEGAILCNMGKPARSEEPAALESAFRDLGIPILGSITGEGTLEGGDAVWIDGRTLAVGRGYRTNDEGIRQLRALLGETIDDLIVVPLPHWRGPTDVFHLMSILSPIDLNLALVYSPLMPVPFRESLLDRGFELLEVPDAEFFTMGTNVLAVAPRVCVMLAGNPETRSRLESGGVRVFELVGEEICFKGAGGPTCLTRPLERGH
jgi:N-dimethylarginine dimethylaminohydrolase